MNQVIKIKYEIMKTEFVYMKQYTIKKFYSLRNNLLIRSVKYFIIMICNTHVNMRQNLSFFLLMFISAVGFIKQSSFKFVIFKNPRMVYSHAGNKVVWQMRGTGCTIIYF